MINYESKDGASPIGSLGQGFEGGGGDSARARPF